MISGLWLDDQTCYCLARIVAITSRNKESRKGGQPSGSEDEGFNSETESSTTGGIDSGFREMFSRCVEGC